APAWTSVERVHAVVTSRIPAPRFRRQTLPSRGTPVICFVRYEENCWQGHCHRPRKLEGRQRTLRCHASGQASNQCSPLERDANEDATTNPKFPPTVRDSHCR